MPAGRAPARSAFSADARHNILFAFAVGIALTLAYFMRETLFLLYVAALFAAVLNPLIRWITQLRVRRWSPGRTVAISLLLLLVAGSATLFFAFVVPPILRDLRQFAEALPTRGPELLDHLRRFPFSSRLNLGALMTRVQDSASTFAEYLFHSLSSWASSIVNIVAVIILMIYFMLEGEVAYRWTLSLFPPRLRPRLDGALQQAETRMGRWLLGQGLLMLIMGVTSIIVFALLRIRYAYALGVFMGVLNIIPIVGGLVGMAAVVLVAAMDTWGKALGAIVFYVIYTQIENSYLTPRIMRSRVDLPGLAVLIALLVGTKLAGVAGAMVAVPTAVLISVLVEEYLVQEPPIQQDPDPEGQVRGTPALEARSALKESDPMDPRR